MTIKSNILLSNIMQAKCKTSMKILFFYKSNDKSVDFCFFKKNIVGGWKHSLIVIRPGQRQGSPVFFA